MSNSFSLDPRLEADSLPILDLGLCHVRLMNNVRFPWLLLVPQMANMREITDLSESAQQQLMREICHCSTTLQRLTCAEKMNVGALGNMVPQLHVHVIARFTADTAWPNPVWGTGGEAYAHEEAVNLVTRLRAALTIL